MNRVRFLACLLLINCISNAEAAYLELPNHSNYLPELHYEKGHKGFPVNIYFDGDNDVENNPDLGHYIEGVLTGNQIPTVYLNVNKVLDKDKDGDPFWTIEYHYYYVNNIYHSIPIPTHRHDWEWVYVVVIEDDEGYIPLLASSGSHDWGGNHESFMEGKYGRYSNKYLDFTQNGSFSLLSMASEDKVIFYVGNDGNAMYGITQCKDIDGWRKLLGNISEIDEIIF
jgi:hypothetical protein